MSLSTTAWVVSLTFVLIVAFQRRRKFKLPLPPGPPKLPLIGNVFSDLTERPWEVYHAWSQEYRSDIIHLDMAGNSIVVLDSYEACVDLLDKRSGLYSSRPRLRMFELMGWLKWNFGLMRYGNAWREHRRLVQQTLNEDSIKSFRSYQLDSAHTMLKNIRSTPTDFEKHIRLMTAQVVLTAIYGFEVDSVDHHYVELAEQLIEISCAVSIAGRYLVEAFPALKYVPRWLPGAGFQRQACVWRATSDSYVDYMLSEVETQIHAGTAKHSVVSHHLEAIEHEKGTFGYTHRREVVGNAAGVMYAAASETTTGSLLVFVLLMMLHPKVQRKAQAELDSVLSRGQLPSFDQLDQVALPYVTALVKETIRYSTITPLLVPHAIESEDEYRGYRIPANSTVFGNGWAILRDEKVYAEPNEFRPERFLKADGTLNPDIRDPAQVAFGFGRRICPGRHFAYSALWISIASMLKTFDISCELDVSGEPFEPVVEYQFGLAVYPKPFKSRIQPRLSEEDALESLNRGGILDG